MKQLHNELQNAGSPILPLKYHKFNTNYHTINNFSQEKHNQHHNIKAKHNNNRRSTNNRHSQNQQRQRYIYEKVYNNDDHRTKSLEDSQEQSQYQQKINLFKQQSNNNNSRSNQQKIRVSHNDQSQNQKIQQKQFPSNIYQQQQSLTNMNNAKKSTIKTDYKNIGHYGVDYQLVQNPHLNSNQKYYENQEIDLSRDKHNKKNNKHKSSIKDLRIDIIQKQKRKNSGHSNANIKKQNDHDQSIDEEEIANGFVCESPLYLQQNRYKHSKEYNNNSKNDIEHKGTYRISRNAQVTYESPLFNVTVQSQHQSSPKMHRNPKKMHLLSQRSSDGHRTQLNINPHKIYKYKYKKYKAKYQNAVSAVRQLQALNKSITKSQRQISICYENNIKSLQQLIIDKDQQIQELSQIIHELKIKTEEFQDTKNLEYKLEQLKKQLSDKQTQIINNNNKYSPAASSMKNSEIQKEKKNLQKQYITLEKKIKHLTKENDNLLRKLKNALQNNHLYEDMLKQKDNRISKLSQFNSQLCREVMKLKDQIQSENNTHDTDRSNLGMTFSKVNNNKLNDKQYHSRIPKIDLNFANTSRSQQVEKYLNCIDEQISLIKEKCLSPSNNKRQNHRDHITKCQSQVEFIGDTDMRMRQQFYENQQSSEYLEEIKKLAEKLTELSKQFSRKTLHQQFI